MSDQWVIIPGWDKFQHYRNRRPAWIKTYVDLLRKDEYLELTPRQRALLHGLWITYADTNGAINLRTSYVQRALNMKVYMRDVEALNHAGFIEISASKPLAHCYPRDRDRDRIPKSLTANLGKTKPTCPECGVVPMHSLEEHLQIVHNRGAA